MGVKTSIFKQNLMSYLFSNTGSATLLGKRPYRWGISLHTADHNPFISDPDSTWWTSSLVHKTKAYVDSWTAVSGVWGNGVTNTNEIVFGAVPTGELWLIEYSIIWGIVDINSIDQLFPIYAMQFDSTVSLNEYDIFRIRPNNYTIVEA